MAAVKSKDDTDSRIRATALRQAHDIEGRKRLKARIADLIVEAFDLPSRPDTDPAHPISADATLFKQCLSLWQPSDLEDLIYERNVDNRCGYALCPKPNQKVQGGGIKVWNHKTGKDFKLLDKAELEKWCSTACQERTMFVRAQLGHEPAWLRDVGAVDIKLLDEMGQNDSLVDSLQVCPREAASCILHFMILLCIGCRCICFLNSMLALRLITPRHCQCLLGWTTTWPRSYKLLRSSEGSHRFQMIPNPCLLSRKRAVLLRQLHHLDVIQIWSRVIVLRMFDFNPRDFQAA